MSFEDIEDDDISLLSEIEDLAGLEDVEDIEAAKKKVVKKKVVKKKVVKKKTKVVLTAKERMARMQGKQIAKTERQKRAKGECGTYDIGCKIQKSISAAGKGLLILGAVLGIAWIGKSYLEKRAMMRTVEYPAHTQRVAIPTAAVQPGV